MVKLTKLERDSLKEVASIGAGLASSKLSTVLKRKIKLTVPYINLLTTKEVIQHVAGTKQLVVGAYMKIQGEVEGTVMLMLPRKDGLNFVDLLQGKRIGSSKMLTAKDQAKLAKMGETISKAYMGTFTKFLGVSTKLSQASVLSTFGELLPDFVLHEIEQKQSLLLKTDFIIDRTTIKGRFILLIALNSVSTVLKRLQKKT